MQILLRFLKKLNFSVICTKNLTMLLNYNYFPKVILSIFSEDLVLQDTPHGPDLHYVCTQWVYQIFTVLKNIICREFENSTFWPPADPCHMVQCMQCPSNACLLSLSLSLSMCVYTTFSMGTNLRGHTAMEIVVNKQRGPR